MSLSSTDVEELKWVEEEGGWRTRVVDSQTECYFKQLRAADPINKKICQVKL